MIYLYIYLIGLAISYFIAFVHVGWFWKTSIAPEENVEAYHAFAPLLWPLLGLLVLVLPCYLGWAFGRFIHKKKSKKAKMLWDTK